MHKKLMFREKISTDCVLAVCMFVVQKNRNKVAWKGTVGQKYLFCRIYFRALNTNVHREYVNPLNVYSSLHVKYTFIVFVYC